MTDRPPPVPTPEPDDLLGVIEFQSATLIRNFEQFRRKAAAFAELDRSWYLLLRILDRSGPADVGSLARELGLDPSTVTRQLSAIESAGLITRIPAPDDRRRIIATPTEQGLCRVRDAAVHRRELTEALLADWDEDARAELARVFTRYNETVRRQYG